MATNAADIEVAVTGSVSYAPAGTALPPDAATALNAAFTDVGYIDSNGVEESKGTSTNDIQAWQNGDVVRVVVTKDTHTFKFAMLETNDRSLGIYYGAANVNNATGAVTVKGGQGTQGEWVIDVFDGATHDRIVIPNGQVTAWDNVAYKSSDAIIRGVTITCYPDATGAKAYIYSSPAVPA